MSASNACGGRWGAYAGDPAGAAAYYAKWPYGAVPASADTRPQGGAAISVASPFTSGAIGEAETPKVSR